jgi:hypothetical protein
MLLAVSRKDFFFARFAFIGSTVIRTRVFAFSMGDCRGWKTLPSYTASITCVFAPAFAEYKPCASPTFFDDGFFLVNGFHRKFSCPVL